MIQFSLCNSPKSIPFVNYFVKLLLNSIPVPPENPSFVGWTRAWNSNTYSPILFVVFNQRTNALLPNLAHLHLFVGSLPQDSFNEVPFICTYVHRSAPLSSHQAIQNLTQLKTKAEQPGPKTNVNLRQRNPFFPFFLESGLSIVTCCLFGCFALFCEALRHFAMAKGILRILGIHYAGRLAPHI